MKVFLKGAEKLEDFNFTNSFIFSGYQWIFASSQGECFAIQF